MTQISSGQAQKFEGRMLGGVLRYDCSFLNLRFFAIRSKLRIQNNSNQTQWLRKMALRSKDVNAEDALLPEERLNRNDHNIKFYEQYRKIFATGYYLSIQLKQLVGSKDDLWKKLLAYEKRAQEEFKDKMRKEAPQRKKRFRRTANEIEKSYHCEAEKCNRSYGSEGSLLQHVKLKHPEKYQEMLAASRLKHQGSENMDQIEE